jgi:hypothetical protein
MLLGYDVRYQGVHTSSRFRPSSRAAEPSRQGESADHGDWHDDNEDDHENYRIHALIVLIGTNF